MPLYRHLLPFGRLWGTRASTLSSVPSSGFLPLSTVPASTRLAQGLATQPIAVASDASRPSFMPLASLELPFRAFPSRGAVPALAGLVTSLWFVFDCRRRRACGTFAVAFPVSRQLFALRTHPEADPGRMSRDDGSSRSLVRSTQPASELHVPSPSLRHWAHRLAAGTPASKLCSPRESVRRRSQTLARLKPTVGALLGFLPFRALSTTVPGSVSRTGARGGLEAPGHARLWVSSRRACIARPGLRRWVREPRIRRYAESIELHVSPSGGDPAHRAPLERSCAPATSPIRALTGVEDGASCPCPLSAAPRAFLPFTLDSPEGAPDAGPRRRWT